jgi:phosphate transport system substrate-binding protein
MREPGGMCTRGLNRVGRHGLALGLAAALLVSNGCGPGSSGPGAGPATVIQNKGSDTMVNLAQSWAEAYRKVRPEVSVEVAGGGSGVGIAALMRGAVDIANSSRDLKPKELEEARAVTGKEVRVFVVGYDALAVYVHPSNPLQEITLEQLEEIYAVGGRISRWSDLGVQMSHPRYDRIIRVSRQSSSGTYEFFRERALRNRDFKLGSNDMNGSKEVVELVASTPGAIGYSGMGYATGRVKMLRVALRAGVPAYAPTLENTVTRRYPIARSLLMCVLGEPAGEIKAYLDWIRSEAGQRLVEENGFVPIPPTERTSANEP